MQKERVEKILFVCSGNICRSPLAHKLFERMARTDGLENKFEVDSCGTGSWNVGHNADERIRNLAQEKGWTLEKISRQIRPSDINYFDHVLVMDRGHLYEIKNMLSIDKVTYHQKLKLFRNFDSQATEDDDEVIDPYYGGTQKFTQVYEIIERTCKGLLDFFTSDKASSVAKTA